MASRDGTSQALARAHRLASSAEELYEEGRWAQAIERYEAASKAFVAATLATSDTTVVQSLRLLANSHSQRAHELRLRATLHDMHEVDESRGSAAAASSAAPSSSSPPSCTSASAHPGNSAEALIVSSAFARLSSQLISTHEELRFGAEELCRVLLPAMTGGSAGGSSALSSSAILAGAKPQQLMDSFCVVSPNGASPRLSRRGFGDGLGVQSSSVLSLAGGAAGGAGALMMSGGSCGSHALDPHHQLVALQAAGDGTSSGTPGAGGSALGSASGAGSGTAGAGDSAGTHLAQLALENSRLASENAALRQRASELGAIFAKVQRRAADQQRLARKALSALREVHNTPRPELPADAAKEVADLRRQLEAAHAARRQQAELVRKYEQRWAQLKASARRKQAAQQAEQSGTQPPPPPKSPLRQGAAASLKGSSGSRASS